MLSLKKTGTQEWQPLGTTVETSGKDYTEPVPAPLFEPWEFNSWSFWRAGIAQFMATFLFLYITILTVMGVKSWNFRCCGMMMMGFWAGGHIDLAVTFGLFLVKTLSLPQAVFYMICQCLGAICGAGVVKGF